MICPSLFPILVGTPGTNPSGGWISSLYASETPWVKEPSSRHRFSSGEFKWADHPPRRTLVRKWVSCCICQGSNSGSNINCSSVLVFKQENHLSKKYLVQVGLEKGHQWGQGEMQGCPILGRANNLPFLCGKFTALTHHTKGHPNERMVH